MKFWTSIALILFTLLVAQLGFSATVDSRMWTTNGEVTTLESDGNTLFVGGRFSYVGPYTNNTLGVHDAVTAAAEDRFPKFNGRVRKVISLGADGWIVAGDFTEVDGQAIHSLVRIKTDFTVDTNFDFNLGYVSSTGNIYDMDILGQTLYVTGYFDRIGGKDRQNLAAIDISDYLKNNAVTANTVIPWNPTIPLAANVIKVHPVIGGQTTIYIGGFFSTVNGTTRNSVAAIFADSRLSGWNPGQYFTGFANIFDLEVNDSYVYIAGSFNFADAAGSTATNLVAVPISSNLALSTFLPNPDNDVLALMATPDGNSVFAGGRFTINFQGVTYNHIVRIASAATTPALSTVPFTISGNGPNATYINDITYREVIATKEQKIYLGGSFTHINNTPRYNIGAYDFTNNRVTIANPGGTDSPVDYIEHISGTVFSSGYHSIGGVHRKGLASFDVNPASQNYGKAKSLDLNIQPNTASFANIKKLKLGQDGNVYVGGNFLIDNSANLARFNAANDAVDVNFTPGPNNQVNDIVLNKDASSIFISGDFLLINSSPLRVQYPYLAQLTSNGVPVQWFPIGPNDIVTRINTLALNQGEDLLFFGGNYSLGGGAANLASINIANATVNALPYAVDGEVMAFARDPQLSDNLYFGGNLLSVNTSAYDVARIPMTLDPLPDWGIKGITGCPSAGCISAISIEPDTAREERIFFGGKFTQVGLLPRHNATSASPGLTASISSWQAETQGFPAGQSVPVNAMLAEKDRLFVGRGAIDGRVPRPLELYNFVTPSTSIDPPPGQFNYDSPPIVTLSCTPEAGRTCTDIWYTINGGVPIVDVSPDFLDIPIALPATPGTYVIRFFSCDDEGSCESPRGPAIYELADLNPPVITSPINIDSTPTNQNSVTLSFTATDPSGVFYYASESATPPADNAFSAFTGSFNFSLSTGDGSKTINLWLRDGQNNRFINPVTLEVIKDQTPPNGTITINNGAPKTNSPNVTILLSSSDPDIDRYYISDSPTRPVDTSVFQAFTTSPINRTLPAGDGTKFVYVWFMDTLGNVLPESTSSASTSIYLDQTAPSIGSISTTPANITNTLNIEVRLNPLDMSYDGSATQYLIGDVALLSLVPGKPTDTSAFTKLLPGNTLPVGAILPHVLSDSDGSKVVYLYLADELDNISNVAMVDITLDRSPPLLPTIDVPTSTQTENLTINFSNIGQDIAEFSVQSANLGLPEPAPVWQSGLPPASLAHTLPADDGIKVIYLKFRDTATNTVSTTRNVTLDGTAPTLPTISLPSLTKTQNITINLSNIPADIAEYSVLSADQAQPEPTPVWQSGLPPASLPHTLPAGDGIKVVYFKFRDSLTNTVSASHNITLDSTAPTLPTIIVPSITQVTNITIGLTNIAADIAEYSVRSADQGQPEPAPIWQTGLPPSSLAHSLPAGDGDKVVYLKFRDAATNEVSDSRNVTLDGTAPTLPTITIPSLTQNENITITLANIPTDIAEYSVRSANQGQAEPTPVWQAGLPPSSLTHSLPAGDGDKVVYLKFRDAATNEVSDSRNVILDGTAPILPTITIPSLTQNENITITLANIPTDIAEYSVRSANQGQAEPTPVWQTGLPPASLSHALPPGDGDKVVYLKFRDAATNEVSDSRVVTLDGTAPVIPTITLPSLTQSENITITLANIAADIAEYSVRSANQGQAEPAPVWQTGLPPTSLPHTLPAGDGIKVVYLKFRDTGTNTVSASHNITLDGTAPVLPDITVPNLTQSENITITLANIPTDIAEYSVRSANQSQPEPAPIWQTGLPPASLSHTLPLGDGIKVVYFKFRDAATNQVIASRNVTIDGTPPTLPNITMPALSQSENITINLANIPSDIAEYSVRSTNQGQPEPTPVWQTGLPPAALAHTLPTGDGDKVVYLKFRDAATNEVSDSRGITLDSTAPVLPTIIVPSLSQTESISIDISSVPVDVTEYSVRSADQGQAEPAPIWQSVPIANPLAHTLPTGDGIKVIYFRFRDATLNEVSTTRNIDLDSTAPALPTITLPSVTQTVNINIILSNIPTDIAEYSILSVDQGQVEPAPVWQAGIPPASIAHTLPVDDGVKVVYLKFRDAATNQVSDSRNITVDSTAPALPTIDMPTLTQTESITINISSVAPDITEYSVRSADLGQGEPSPVWQSGPVPASLNHTLPLGDGDKVVYFRFRDAATNEVAASRGINLDGTAPTLPTINMPNISNSASIAISFTNIPTDIAEYSVLSVNQGDVEPVPVWQSGPLPNNLAHDLPLGDGIKVVYLRFRDNANNEVGDSRNITLDGTPPALPTISIPTTTQSENINIGLSNIPADIAEYSVLSVNQGQTEPAAVWQNGPLPNTLAHSLPLGDGGKVIYLKFRDVAGNEVGDIFNITLDSTAPTLPDITVPGATQSVSITISFANIPGDIAEYSVQSVDQGQVEPAAVWQSGPPSASINHVLPAGDGIKVVYLKFRDTANNEVSTSRTTTLDGTAPNFSNLTFNDTRIQLVDGNNYTNSANVLVSFDADDALSNIVAYHHGENNASHNAPGNSTVAVNGNPINVSNLSIDFTNTSNGAKVLYFWVEDALGNVSSAQSLTVTLDNQLSGTLLINGSTNPGTTNSQTAAVDISSTDLSGIVAYYISNDPTPPADAAYTTVSPRESNFTRSLNNYDLGAGDGTKTVHVWLKDAAGNTLALQNSVILDATAPTLSITSHSEGQFIGANNLTLAGDSNGNSVTVTVGGNSQTVTPAAGSWSANLTGLQEGENTITVTATDGINTTTPLLIHINVDTSAPPVPTASQPLAGTLIRDPAVLFVGQTEPLNGVRITMDGNPIGSATAADQNGDWQINLSGIGAGPHDFIIIVSDQANNERSSLPVNITFDLLNDAPVAQSSTSPILAQEGLAATGNMQATDPEGDGFSFNVTTDVTKGVLNYNPTDGSFDYTPNAGETGTDSFSFQVTDDYAGGAASSAIATIEFELNAKPSAPELLTPDDGATGIDPNSAVFTWNKSTDPDGDAISYELHVCESNAFDCTPFDVAWWQTDDAVIIAGFGSGSAILLALYGLGTVRRRYWLAIALVLALTACGKGSNGADNTPPPDTSNQVSKSIAGLSSNTSYFWKVIAIDARGGRNESEVRSFTTEP